jgi:hypothetical protein
MYQKNSVANSSLILQSLSSSQSGKKRIKMQPLHPQTKTLLSSRSRSTTFYKSTKIFLLHLRVCLHTAQSNQVMINPFTFFMFHLHQQIPPTLRMIMQPYWLHRSNPSNITITTTFNKLSRDTSLERKATH